MISTELVRVHRESRGSNIIPYADYVGLVLGATQFEAMEMAGKVLSGEMRLQRDPQKDARLVWGTKAFLPTFKRWAILASLVPQFRRLVAQELVSPQEAISGLEEYERNALGERPGETRRLTAEAIERNGGKWVPADLLPVIKDFHQHPEKMFEPQA